MNSIRNDIELPHKALENAHDLSPTRLQWNTMFTLAGASERHKNGRERLMI
jgi:hypothetical protein